VRTKEMTMDPLLNKYIANYSNIEEIQSYLLKNALENEMMADNPADYLFNPKLKKDKIIIIENTDVDRSIAMLMEQIALKCQFFEDNL
jgi:2-phosphoglycerate kinase